MDEIAVTREHYITGGDTYPPVYEVVIHGETVGVFDTYLAAVTAFAKSLDARGIVLPEGSEQPVARP